MTKEISQAVSWHVPGQKVEALEDCQNFYDEQVFAKHVYTIKGVGWCGCHSEAGFTLVGVGKDRKANCLSIFRADKFRPIVEPKVEKEEKARGPLDHLFDFVKNPPAPVKAPERELEPV